MTWNIANGAFSDGLDAPIDFLNQSIERSTQFQSPRDSSLLYKFADSNASSSLVLMITYYGKINTAFGCRRDANCTGSPKSTFYQSPCRTELTLPSQFM